MVEEEKYELTDIDVMVILGAMFGPVIIVIIIMNILWLLGWL